MILDAFMDNMTALLIVISSAAMGTRILQCIKMDFKYSGEEFVYSAAVGLGVVGYIIFALGIAGLLYREITYLLLALLLILSYTDIRKMLLDLIYFLRFALRSVNLTRTEAFLLVGIIFYLFLTLIRALSPPLEFDPIAYHLPLPKMYIQQHRIIYNPLHYQSMLPFNMEMLFTLSMLVHSDIVAQLLDFYMSILLLMALYYFARTYLNRSVALLSMLIFYSIHFISWISSGAYNDIGWSLYSLLAFISFVKWAYSKRNYWLVISAITSGLSLGFKYQSFNVFCLIFLSIVIFSLLRKNCPKVLAKTLLAWAGIALLIASPCYVKNYIITGNPFFPAFYSFWRGRYWTEFAEKQHLIILDLCGMGKDPRAFLLLPWNLTINGERFHNLISPILLAFLPFLIFMKNVDKAIRYILIFSLGYIIIWFMQYQNSRFLLPILALLSVATAYSIYRVCNWSRGFRMATSLFSSIALLFQLGRLAFLNFKVMPVVLGVQTRQQYLSANLDIYDVCIYINKNLDSKKDKVFALGIDRDYYSNLRFYGKGVLYHFEGDINKFLDELKIMQITYLLVESNQKEYYNPFLNQIRKKHSHKKYAEGIFQEWL